jgi:hypothetical protein
MLLCLRLAVRSSGWCYRDPRRLLLLLLLLLWRLPGCCCYCPCELVLWRLPTPLLLRLLLLRLCDGFMLSMLALAAWRACTLWNPPLLANSCSRSS